MKTVPIQTMKRMLRKYCLFMLPAMLLASKGFADLWISGYEQPYLALTLLLLSSVTALLLLTMASVFLFLLHRQFWIPPWRLIVLITGMKLYFDYSLGNTIGMAGLIASVGLWCIWGSLAYRQYRSIPEQS